MPLGGGVPAVRAPEDTHTLACPAEPWSRGQAACPGAQHTVAPHSREEDCLTTSRRGRETEAKFLLRGGGFQPSPVLQWARGCMPSEPGRLFLG